LQMNTLAKRKKEEANSAQGMAGPGRASTDDRVSVAAGREGSETEGLSWV
jgi:hypothetical protein